MRWGLAIASLAAVWSGCIDGEGAPRSGCSDGGECRPAATLLFEGALPGERDRADLIPSVALGGRHRIHVKASRAEVSGADFSARERALLDARYDLRSGTETSADLVGLAEGDTEVVVLASLSWGERRILGRLPMHVAPVAAVELLVVGAEGLRAGVPGSIVFRLLAADGRRLVDEDLAIRCDRVAFERSRWDRVDLVAPPAGEVTFELEAGGRRFTAHLPVR